jgi:transcriptional regulator with XRE-family HTH domain
MRKRGLTGKELAEQAGISVTAVSLILGNKYIPRGATFSKIVRVLAPTKQEYALLADSLAGDAITPESRSEPSEGGQVIAYEAKMLPSSRVGAEFESEIWRVLSAAGLVVKESARSLPYDLLIETDPKIHVLCKPNAGSSGWFDAIGRALYRKHLVPGSRAIVAVPYRGRYFDQLFDFFKEYDVVVATPDTLVDTIDQLTAPSGRNFARDIDSGIIKKMHRNSVTLVEKGKEAWGTRFIGWRADRMIYDTWEDQDLWTDPLTKKLFAPEAVLGRRIQDPLEVVRAMGAEGFSPVYEGRHVEQFVFGGEPIRWWLKRELAQAKYGRESWSGPFLVYRRISSSTNQRTCIAAILPSGSAASNSLSGLIPERVEIEAAAVVLNSFCFDYALRLRTATININPTHMRHMPVPPTSVTNSMPRVPTVCAWEHGIKQIAELKEHWESLWVANKAVAKAYGLSQDDFRHILASFPVFAKKHEEFFGFLTAKLGSEPW